MLISWTGSDLMLIKLVEGALKAADWPTEVMTGRLTFELGENVRNCGQGNVKSNAAK